MESNKSVGNPPLAIKYEIRRIMNLTPTAINPISKSIKTLEEFLNFKPFTKFRLSASREATLDGHLEPYWKSKGLISSDFSKIRVFLDNKYNSPLHLQGSYVYCVPSATVIPKLAHVLLSDKQTIMERFGSRIDFLRNMESYGSYFGYSVASKIFEINPLHPHFSVFSTPVVNFSDESSTAILFSNDENDKCYTHWLMLRLLDIFSLVPIIERAENPLLIFSYEPTAWQLQSIAHIFPSLRMRYLIANTATRFKRLLIVRSPPEHRFHGNYLKFLYDSGIRDLHKLPRVRLFISRTDASGRRIANMESAYAVLKRFDFEVVELSKISFSNQIGLFAAAKSIIFISGSSGMNLLFSCPSISVGIIQHPAQSEDWVQSSYLCGISAVTEYAALPLDISNTNCDLFLDPIKFDGFVRRVVANERANTEPGRFHHT